jgi:hypothetical protein
MDEPMVAEVYFDSSMLAQPTDEGSGGATPAHYRQAADDKVTAARTIDPVSLGTWIALSTLLWSLIALALLLL